jgi:hypothetical protein
MKNVKLKMSAARQLDWGAHASGVRVAASRRNLCHTDLNDAFGATPKTTRATRVLPIFI